MFCVPATERVVWRSETAPRKREEWTWLDNHGIDRGFGCY
jgi:hypothetical protein